MGGSFPGALLAQALGVFLAQFGWLARLLIAGGDAVARRQFELFGRGARQALRGRVVISQEFIFY